jgi:hypothetical protein
MERDAAPAPVRVPKGALAGAGGATAAALVPDRGTATEDGVR